MAYVADSAPERPVWLASVVVSKAPMLGLTLGALVSGAVVETSPNARIVVYVVMTALLVVCLGFILAVAETGTRRPGLGASLRPRIHLPRRSRAQVPVMACIVTATWAVGGWFQAFGPAVTAEQLHTSNAVVVALVFSSYMAPSIIGAPIGARLATAAAQRLGMIAFTLALLGLLAALVAGTVVPFLIC
ncbi:hypothetical protein GCM10028781_05150 [Nostocoides australiense]